MAKVTYYLVAQIDWMDRQIILASGTAAEMEKLWKENNGEYSVGGYHAWLDVLSDREMEEE